MYFLSSLRTPLPKDFRAVADVVLNADLRDRLGMDAPDADRVRALLRDARAFGVALDGEGLGFVLKETLERVAEDVRRAPSDPAKLHRLMGLLRLVEEVPFDGDHWKVQNLYWELLQEGKDREGAEAGTTAAVFRKLGEELRFRVE